MTVPRQNPAMWVFLAIMAGLLLQWPTLPTLAMFQNLRSSRDLGKPRHRRPEGHRPRHQAEKRSI
ncbi:MAG: hypothetical protein HYR49_01800 [Gammaproteobacteria bacterium]|nr:hypothetical protein [Gammaproteobacteria bacterium]